jgi:DNA polymerase (family 10)
MPSEKIFKIKGVGEGIGKKVIEIIETGELQILKDIVAQTPDGIFEMMNIKGLGPKKIHLLWKELHISDIDSLKEACQQNKLSEKKRIWSKNTTEYP